LLFFFQAEDGIRDLTVTGVQTCALPIFSMKFRGSKPLTSAAIWQAKLPGSKCVILATPLFPATMFFQTSELVLPTAQIRPRPVRSEERRVGKDCSVSGALEP